ncbi:MAG: O-antigen ligase family protein [Planctomycetes bacterium]|nr:O-antigen ligase family protein [Planctomycetota bacterium]
MTAAIAPPSGSLPRWLPWAFVLLLVLPFQPFWLDFEQVRRGLLLALAGAVLLLAPRLGPAAGERQGLWFLGALALAALVNLGGQALAATEAVPVSFQPWDALYRLAHWLALGVVLRLGAAAPHAFALPLAGTLLVTSLYGLLQRLGLAEVAGYGLPAEPVSVFGNLNVAAEWTAVAAAATAALAPRPRWLPAAALAGAAAYLVVDGSRSGLVALPLGLLLLAILRRRAARPWLPLAVAAAGALGGLAIEALAPRSAPADAAAAQAAAGRAAKTLAVRLEIAKGGTRLVGEAPLFGHGPGQFAVVYPRVRSQAEIEASTQGRQFAAAVRTAHDDWLELLVDGGLLALGLFTWLLFALQRGAGDRARLVPLFVLLLLMLARSPLWNAPAVAAALLLAGRPAPAPPAAARTWRVLLRGALALALLALGALPLLANTFFVPYQRARAQGGLAPVASLEQVRAVMPFEPSWHQLLAQEQMFRGDLAAAATSAARALRLRPYDPQLHVLLGEILARGNRPAEAEQVARHALRLDPPNPELRLLLGTVLAGRGAQDAAVEALAVAPHPRLRARLAEAFAGLADRAQQKGDEAGAARYRAEQHFVQAIDTLGVPSPGALAATGEHLRELLQAMRGAGMLRRDCRGHVVGALHALDLGQPDTAIRLGEDATQLGVRLLPWQQALLGDKLAPLRAVPDWQPVLGR